MKDKHYRYSAKGRVRYGHHKDAGGQGWVVLDCPTDIVHYYNSVYKWLLWTQRISKPLHGAHITVVAGKYSDVDISLWGYRDGDIVDFSYGPVQNKDEGYYWLPCKCEAAVDIRTHLGLTPEPLFQYHLTIGFRA